MAWPLLGHGMTEKYNEALNEQLKKNVWERTREAASNMSPLDRAELIADVAGIFDPTPVSDGAGLAIALIKGDALGAVMSLGSMVPYLGDAVAKPLKIARKAPQVASAIEAALKAGDKLAGAGKGALQEAGLTLQQVAAARQKALESVRKAMLDAKARTPNCETCKLVGSKGQKRELQMPANGGNGTWRDGVQPADGNGVFRLNDPRTLPDGRQVDEIAFRNGSPDFDDYVEGGKHQLWEVSGDALIDRRRLTSMMRETDPRWLPPDEEFFTLHHFDDGTVGYVPTVLHDKRVGGVAHSGGNSMLNNQLF